MSDEKIAKGIYDVASAKYDYYKCIEYEERIYKGEDLIIEANKFAIDKVNEIYGKSPEIINMNGVVATNELITKETALRSLAIAKKVINDQILKDSINLTKDSFEELNNLNCKNMKK